MLKENVKFKGITLT